VYSAGWHGLCCCAFSVLADWCIRSALIITWWISLLFR